MSKTSVTQINRELKRWQTASRKFKTSSQIFHAKIKSGLAIFESKASKDEIRSMQSEMGKLKFSFIILKYIFQC